MVFSATFNNISIIKKIALDVQIIMLIIVLHGSNQLN
jgi:hypothetical protein